MMNFQRATQIVTLVVAGTAVTACAPLFPTGSDWRSWLSQDVAQTSRDPATTYYDRAVTAIRDRHYALALDYLQAARVGKLDDVRILTAFGVIYDKLGRFDLSARYYTQAAQIDPKSTIVMADMAYSRKLQGLAGPPAGSAELAEAAPMTVGTSGLFQPGTGIPHDQAMTRPVQLVKGAADDVSVATRTSAGEVVVVRQVTSSRPSAVKAVLLTGHPLLLVNASGQADPAQSIRAHLAGLGWTVSSRTDQAPNPQQMSAIFYQPPFIHAAQALARTISYPVHIVPDNEAMGLRLMLGRDFLESKYTGLNLSVRHLARAEIAAGNGAN